MPTVLSAAGGTPGMIMYRKLYFSKNETHNEFFGCM
jgi:hypothetical protein